jgi:hypothetical protein
MGGTLEDRYELADAWRRATAEPERVDAGFDPT